MRRKVALTLALGTALVVSAMAIVATAMAVVIESPVSAKFGGGVVPGVLPKHEMASVTLKIRGEFSRLDGTQPPALREATIDFDRAGAINATGLPVCKRSRLEANDTAALRRVCGKSIIGTGTAQVAIKSSPYGPTPTPLTIFNGGVKGGTTTLFIRSATTLLTPRPLVATVTIGRIHQGPYGLQAASKIPPIAGEGSVLNFSLTIKRLFRYKGTTRSYTTATCPDGHLSAKASTVFTDGITIRSTIARSCVSKG